MTKKEQALVADLERQIRLLKAWRLTDEVKPDVAPPDSYLDLVYGYHAHAWDLKWKVERAATSSGSHYVGEELIEKLREGRDRYYCGSQNAIWLFSKRSAALRAARYKVERYALETLAKLDAEIEAAEAEEQL